MPAERLRMRRIREVLRLKYARGASDRVISRSVGIGRTATVEYVRRAAVIGITRPIPEELDDTALERKLFAPAGYNPRSKPLPEGACPCRVAPPRRNAGAAVGGIPRPSSLRLRYSRFCELYVEWRHGITATMRQTHAAGEKLFLEFASKSAVALVTLEGPPPWRAPATRKR